MLVPPGFWAISSTWILWRPSTVFTKTQFIFFAGIFWKICEFYWHSNNALDDWAVHDILAGKYSLRDWWECAVPAIVNKILDQITVSEMFSLEIPCLFSNNLPEIDNGTKRYQIFSACYPVCLMTEARRGAWFAHAEKVVLTYIL